jgi:LPS-assembly lipoprotein
MSRDVSSISWSRPWSRRRLLGASGLLALSGCGFRPLYGPAEQASTQEPGLLEALASIRVGSIPERTGQLLRRSLQRRFEDGAPGTPARYNLQVSVSYAAEPLGYRSDGAITRLRYTATASWTLSTLSVPPQQIAASGIPYRTIDSFNIPDLQFFAADSSRDAMERRLVDVIAEEIHQQVALEMRRRMETKAT